MMTKDNAELAVWAELDRLADGNPSANWRWSIPANPARDSDLILGAGLKAIAAERDAALAVIERVRVAAEAILFPEDAEPGRAAILAIVGEATK